MNWPLLQNSLLVAALTAGGSVALGFLAALCLAGSEPRRRHGLVGLAILALAMPPFLVTNCWLDLAGETGALHRWFPLTIYSLGGTVWILTLLTWPIPLLAALTSWQRLEPSQLESDPALRGFALLRWLLWPAARQAVGLAATLTFVLALSNFAVPAILQVKVFPAEMWVSFNTNLNAGLALWVGWPLLVAPLAFLFWLGRSGEIPWPRLEGRITARLLRRQLGGGWFLTCAVLTAMLLGLSVAAPLAQLAASRRPWLELWPALAAGRDALANSAFFAAGAATITVLVAVWLPSRFLLRRPARFGVHPLGCPRSANTLKRGHQTALDRQNENCGPFAGLIRSLLWFPLFVPGVFLGVILIWVFNRPGLDWFYRGSGVVLLALSLRYLAPAWFGIRSAMESLDRDLLDAARLEGANHWFLVRHVLWPQLGGPLAAVWYVAFLLCLWDVETLVLILPPGGETLASRIFNLLHYGHSGQVNALCVWLLMLAVLPLAMWQMARKIRACRFPASALCANVVLLAVLIGLSGCTAQPSANEAPLKSRFFSRAEIIGSRGVGAGEFNKPRSLALDTNDNLFVVDMTGRVQKFSPEGKYLQSWQMPQTDLGKPKGMGRDRDGNIVVIEPHYQRVNHFSATGQRVAQWGGHLTNGGFFSLPRAVAVNSRNEVLVSEYTLAERVQVFSALGKKKLFEFGRPGTGQGEFNRAEGLAVDGADRIYVADSCNHRVQVFSADGKFLRAYGQAGRGQGELGYPYDIAVDASGRQYVCEFGNSRIQVFDAQGQPLEIIGGPGAAAGRFANPWGIAFDSKGNLFVADSQNHRVQKLVRRKEASSARTTREPFRLAVQTGATAICRLMEMPQQRSAGFQPALDVPRHLGVIRCPKPAGSRRSNNSQVRAVQTRS